jgi:hypothetical protein
MELFRVKITERVPVFLLDDFLEDADTFRLVYFDSKHLIRTITNDSDPAIE